MYEEIWIPTLNEQLICRREPGNFEDLITCCSSCKRVGHVPRKIHVSTYFIRRGGTIVCTITGGRQYSSNLVQ